MNTTEPDEFQLTMGLDPGFLRSLQFPIFPMKIVVFGAAGWLGRAILTNLSAGHEVTAFDRGQDAWISGNKREGEWTAGRIVEGDVADYGDVDEVVRGMDAVVHAAVHANDYGVDSEAPFLVNLKGLWNVLESAQQNDIARVVHIGSCQVEHPDGVFFNADVRRPDGSLYAVTKRLQEEMCRQFHDAFGLSQVVLRPCSIIDSRLGSGKDGPPFEPGTWEMGWVCRHDIAEACRLAIEKEGIDFDILHVVGSPDADQHCNVARAREVLGMSFTSRLGS